MRDERQISLRTNIPTGNGHNVASNRNTDRQLESIGSVRCVAPNLLTVHLGVVAAGLGPHITQSCVRNYVCLADRQIGFGSSAETKQICLDISIGLVESSCINRLCNIRGVVHPAQSSDQIDSIDGSVSAVSVQTEAVILVLGLQHVAGGIK